MKKLVFLASCAALIVTFVFATNYYKGRQVERLGFLAEKNAATFVRDHSPTFGSDQARVYLVEFMDPACETCAAFSPFVKKLLDGFPGKIKLVLRYAPFHDGADYFVKILEAARRQGKYWETLEVMYKSQPYWANHHNPQPLQIWKFLPAAGLDLDRVMKDIGDPAIARLIEQDLADARTLDVRKTPGFFVNGKPLQTFGADQLLALVRTEIAAKYPN